MTIRPAMLEALEGKLRDSVVQEVIVPTCCIGQCRKVADFLLVIRYRDGSTDAYGLCADDLARLREGSAAMPEGTQRQGVFLNPI